MVHGLSEDDHAGLPDTSSPPPSRRRRAAHGRKAIVALSRSSVEPCSKSAEKRGCREVFKASRPGDNRHDNDNNTIIVEIPRWRGERQDQAFRPTRLSARDSMARSRNRSGLLERVWKPAAAALADRGELRL